jgi:hypothetical protein
MSLSSSGFRKNWRNESHNLCKNVNKILSQFVQSGLHKIGYSRCAPQFIEFRENWRTESHVLLAGVNKFPSYFPHLLLD